MTVFVRQYDCIRMPLLLMLLLLHPVCVDCCASFWAPVMGPSPYRNVCVAACIALFDVIVCVAVFVVCVAWCCCVCCLCCLLLLCLLLVLLVVAVVAEGAVAVTGGDGEEGTDRQTD